jgi:dihydroorotase-like cyclic amidohydrolase
MDESVEMGPIDYILVEWPGRQPNGEAAPHLVDLVDRGLIRILDLAFVTKGEDGAVAGIELADLGDGAAEFEVFEGASSGLLSDDDLGEAAAALEPGTSAAILVYENTWAAPFAAAVRRSGGQLVASGRIPVNAFLAALDEAEANA